MARYKYIYWRPDLKRNEKGELYADIHFLIKDSPGTIDNFQKMADEIRKTFPQASDNEIYAKKIISPRRLKNSTIVIWSAYIPEGHYPGWQQFPNGKIGYSW